MPQQDEKPESRPAFESRSASVLRVLTGSQPALLRLEVPGFDAPISARTTLNLDAGALERAVTLGQHAVVVFERGDPRLPIVVGLLQPQPQVSALQELLLERPAAEPGPQASAPRSEARLDGRRVVLEGKEEVVLRCGDASVTLRRDGKVILKGAYIETHARGVNRIKGSSVKIN